MAQAAKELKRDFSGQVVLKEAVQASHQGVAFPRVLYLLSRRSTLPREDFET